MAKTFMDGVRLIDYNPNAKKNHVYPAGRRCIECMTPISRYNRNNTCWSHTTISPLRVKRRGK